MTFSSLRLRLYPELKEFPAGKPRRDAWFDARLEVRSAAFLLTSLAVIGAAIGGVLFMNRILASGAPRILLASISLTLPLVVVGCLWFAVWRTIRRSLRRQLERQDARTCHECGYDMRRNPSPFCPECGTVVPLVRPDRGDVGWAEASSVATRMSPVTERDPPVGRDT